jgi:hypothetical protein
MQHETPEIIAAQHNFVAGKPAGGAARPSAETSVARTPTADPKTQKTIGVP